MRFVRAGAASLMAFVLLTSVSACSSGFNSSSGYVAPSCDQLLAAAVNYERTGVGDIDSTMQALADSCSDEYDIAVDYVAHSAERAFGIDSCDELRSFGIRAESVELLEQDGRCSFSESTPAVDPQWPNAGLGWDTAREYASTLQRVCGPLRSARETSDWL